MWSYMFITYWQHKYQVLDNKYLQDTTVVSSTTDHAGSMLSVNEMSCPLPSLFQDDVITILHPYFEFVISVSNDGSSFVSVESNYTYLVYDAACVNCTGGECYAVVSPYIMYMGQLRYSTNHVYLHRFSHLQFCVCAFRVLNVFYFQTDFNLRLKRKRDVRLTCKRV